MNPNEAVAAYLQALEAHTLYCDTLRARYGSDFLGTLPAGEVLSADDFEKYIASCHTVDRAWLAWMRAEAAAKTA